MVIIFVLVPHLNSSPPEYGGWNESTKKDAPCDPDNDK